MIAAIRQCKGCERHLDLVAFDRNHRSVGGYLWHCKECRRKRAKPRNKMKVRRRLPWRERFENSYIPEPNSGCWLWTGYCNEDGYGIFSIKSRLDFAHRVSWRLARSASADGLSVLHKCDVPCCVNPDHLFLGTQADNMRDAANKGRLKRLRRERRQAA